MKSAMKAKDTLTLQTVRLIRSAFANAAIELRTEKLTDEEVRMICPLCDGIDIRISAALGGSVGSAMIVCLVH